MVSGVKTLQNIIYEVENPPAAANSATVNNQLHYNIKLPKAFDLDKPDTWKVWIKKFERFRIATEFEKSSQEYLVNILLYSMGEQSEELVTTLKLAEEELRSYVVVKNKIET